MMTLKELKGMKPNTIFASGIGLIEHPWFNNAKSVAKGGTLEKDGKSTKVKWVAIRGFIEDWAIYHSMDANLTQADYFDNPEHLTASNERIAKGGAKLHDEETIRKFVPCDDEGFKMYRY
ncbi:hypothetical protein IID22_03880 [Patescibacteria group bacterium]|nr:hypothetical protein [Patescibacteria group bacterium]